MNEFILIFLEKICEAIYFSLFLIFGKNLKEKRFLFILIMIFEYLLLKHFIKYNVWFQISYTFMTYIILKVLYKEKTQITDIFLFMIASIFLIIISGLFAFITYFYIKNYYLMLILLRIAIFICLFFIKNKINILYKNFYLQWNKHKNNKIKSLTIRNVSIIIFNLMFYTINLGMIICIYTYKI